MNGSWWTHLFCIVFGHRRRFDYDLRVHYCARRGCPYLEGD